MSSIVVAGDTSGSITLSAPAIAGSTTLTLPSTSGTVLTNASSLAGMSGYPVITLGTPVNSTSGTDIDFTGIPSGTKAIRIMLDRVSTSGSANYLIRLGDSGGIETTGYYSEAARESGTVVNSTVGLIMSASLGASQQMSGVITLALENASTYTWTAVGMFGTSAGSVQFGTGSKSLSAELTQVRITTTTPDTFNNGQINIQYS